MPGGPGAAAVACSVRARRSASLRQGISRDMADLPRRRTVRTRRSRRLSRRDDTMSRSTSSLITFRRNSSSDGRPGAGVMSGSVWQTAVTDLVRLALRYARGRGLVSLAAHPPHPRSRPHLPTSTVRRLDAPAGARLAAGALAQRPARRAGRRPPRRPSGASGTREAPGRAVRRPPRQPPPARPHARAPSR